RRDAILDSDDGQGLGKRNFLSAEHLAEHLEEAPVWIIPVLLGAATSTNPRTGASIYGAVQQLMLAARAYGIGATITSLYQGHEDDVKRLLNIPEDALTMALIPLGYPSQGRWAQPKRRPVEDVTHWNQWGQRLPFTASSGA
ncbi:MAG: nitroreductase family protein, partial [Chloroflexi bacterium]|nr:nitroreductase family protein [Chloroflexota bacterium]